MTLICIILLCPLLLPIVCPCSSSKTLADIASDYTTVRAILDKADQDLRDSNISTDCPEPTPSPRRKGMLRTLHKLACRMKRLQVSFTERLVEAVLMQRNCQCSATTEAPSRRQQDNRLCRVKRFLYSIRECYQRVNTLNAGSRPPQ